MSWGCKLQYCPGRARALHATRPQCAQKPATASGVGPAPGPLRGATGRADSGLCAGDGDGSAFPEVLGHRASHPLSGGDLVWPFTPPLWRWLATSGPRGPSPRAPHSAGTQTAGGRHALTCAAAPPRGPGGGSSRGECRRSLEKRTRPAHRGRASTAAGVGRAGRGVAEHYGNENGIKAALSEIANFFFY